MFNYNIYNQQKVRDEYKRQKKSLLPLDLRKKLTRRERLRLPNNYRFKKTSKQIKLINKYPRRKFALINTSQQLSSNIKQLNIKTVLSQKKLSNRYYQYLRKKQNASKSLRNKKDKKDNKDNK